MKIRTFSLGNTRPVELGLTSTIFLTGFTGVILLPFYLYLFGAGVFWEYFGVLLCMMIVWSSVSFKLMRYARRGKDIMSLPGYFSYRFGGSLDYIRVFSAIEISILSVVIVSLLVKELGFIINMIFGYNQSVVTFVIIMILSLEVGLLGMIGITRTAPYKAVAILLILIIIDIYMYSSAGIGRLVRNMMEIDITGSVSDYMNVLFHDKKPLTVQDYISLISMGLLASGTPFFLSTFFTVRNARSIISGRRVMMLFAIMEFVAAAFFGAISRGYLFPERLTNSLSEYISLLYFRFRQSGSAGETVGVLLIIMIVLGFVVTIEGALHICIVCIYEDILNKGRLIRVSHKHEDRNIVICSVMTGLVIFLVNAYMQQLSINIVLVFIATLGCSIAPTVSMSLAWKRMNRFGCLAGLISGMVSVPVFKYAALFSLDEEKISLCDLLGVNSVIPSMVFTFLVIALVSLITPPPEEELVTTFINVRNRISE